MRLKGYPIGTRAGACRFRTGATGRMARPARAEHVERRQEWACATTQIPHLCPIKANQFAGLKRGPCFGTHLPRRVIHFAHRSTVGGK